MSRRTSSPAALLAFLLAACGQSAQPGATPAGAAAPPPARSTAAPPTGRPGSFTILAQGKAALGAVQPSAAVPKGTAAAPVRMDELLGVPSFLWARPGAPAGGVASARVGGTPRPRSPVEAARAHLGGAAAAYRLGARDAAAAEAARVHDTGHGPIVVSFRQRPGGVAVFGEEASVLMARDLSLVAISGALSPADPAALALDGGAWRLDARAALAAALTDVTGEAFAPGDVQAAGQAGQVPAYDLLPAVAAARAERLLHPATVERVWFRLPAGLRPAWHVELAFQRAG
jgi:hypothetical protein